MNTIRLIVIALPMMLLIACGGGGSNTAVSTPTPMTPPTNTPDPMTPPTTGGQPTMPTEPQELPTALIADPSVARSRLSGSSVSTTTMPTEIQAAFEMEAREAGTLLTSDDNVTIGGNTFMFSLEEIRKGVADRFNLTRFNSQYNTIMDYRGIMFAQYQAAGRTDNNDVLEYQSYGGWLTESAFSVDMLTINDGSNESSALVGVSYGNASGSRPTGTGVATWNGSAVGMHNTSKDVIQGNAEVIIANVAIDRNIHLIQIFGLQNLSKGTSVNNDMSWSSVPIDTDGTFSSTTGGDIDGAFYGTGHMEVGGTFNRNNIIGAFGGTRQ